MRPSSLSCELLVLTLTAAVTLVCPAPAIAAPPRVISAVPDSGDADVDPTITQLRIEFDQDMDTRGGFSICGGGPRFPKLSGKPSWESPSVLVIPVSLEASHPYEFNINCQSARNFKNAAGEPAVITPISFATAADKAAAGGATFSAASRRRRRGLRGGGCRHRRSACAGRVGGSSRRA